MKSLSSVCRAAMMAVVLIGTSGCAGLIVGAGATAGVAAYEQRSVGDQAKDIKIHTQITSAWLQYDQMFPIDFGVEVYEGRVLLTGIAKEEQKRADAVRLAWTADGVREVYNEIQVGEGGNVARDSWITTQLTSKITFDKQISAINYSIETVDGTIYLIGAAKDQAELDKVIAHARTIEFVRKVVSHVEVKGVS